MQSLRSGILQARHIQQTQDKWIKDEELSHKTGNCYDNYDMGGRHSHLFPDARHTGRSF